MGVSHHKYALQGFSVNQGVFQAVKKCVSASIVHFNEISRDCAIITLVTNVSDRDKRIISGTYIWTIGICCTIDGLMN